MPSLAHINPATGTLSLDTVVALQLLSVFKNSDNDIDEVVHFISEQPALAEETLKRCNSLRFRGSEPVSDIFEAVSRLGFYELYSIVADSLTSQGIDPEAPLPPDGIFRWEQVPPLAAND